MRTKVLIAVLGLSYFNGIAHADDSIVNLSVLDNLEGQSTSAVFSTNKPLFPVIYPKANQDSKNIKPKPTKKKAKKAIIKKEKNSISKVKQVEVKKAEPETKEKAQKLENKPIKEQVEKTTPQMPEKQAAQTTEKVEVIGAETVMPLENKQSTPLSLPKAEESKSVEMEKPIESSNNKQESLLKENETEVLNNEQAQTSQVPLKAEEEKAQAPSLLVEENPKPQEEASNKKAEELYFQEDAEELTQEQKDVLDKLSLSFENPQENKIAIYAYNYVSGEDSFRRKRIALNRAVNIRSYLLSKGYKNYSMKVINIEEKDGKENSVHIEELK